MLLKNLGVSVLCFLFHESISLLLEGVHLTWQNGSVGSEEGIKGYVNIFPFPNILIMLVWAVVKG